MNKVQVLKLKINKTVFSTWKLLKILYLHNYIDFISVGY